MMNARLALIFGSVAVAFAAEGAEWTHNDIEAWDKIGDCANPANTYQSPINFDAAGSFAPSGSSLTINYPESIEAAVANNAHGSPQIFFKPGASVTFNGETYNLLQVHFHSPSEETIDGAAPAFDAHFVHQNPDTKDLLVIGQLYNAGSAPLPLLQSALDNVPAGNGTDEADIPSGVALAANIPSNAEFFTFAGSLTTPPCSGGVQWFVNKEIQSASAAQIAALKKFAEEVGGLENGNARPTQPLNGRDVTITTLGQPGGASAGIIASGIAAAAGALAMLL